MTASLGFDVGAYTAHRGSDGGGGGGGGAGAFDALSGFAHPLGVLRESASKEGALNELGGGGGDGGGGDKCGSGGGGGDDTDAIFPLSGMAAGGVQRFPSGGGVHNFPSVRLGFSLRDGPHRCPHPCSATIVKHGNSFSGRWREIGV
jgi:hypothetical protein